VCRIINRTFFYCFYCRSLVQIGEAVIETRGCQTFFFIDFIVARWLKLIACIIGNQAFSLSPAGLGFIAVKVECLCWLRWLLFIDFIADMVYCFFIVSIAVFYCLLLSLLPFIAFYCFSIVSYCFLLLFIEN
jgi:hypothetical protein